MSTRNPTPELPRGPLRLLLGLAIAESLLSIFQWAELIVMRRGGETLCGINEIFNCETVWNSRFAAAVHGALGVPVAGMGLVWGAAAVFLSAAVLVRKGKAQARIAPAMLPALRALGGVGTVACVGLGIASTFTKSLCPTCLVTYALVLAFGAVALFRLPGPLLPSFEQLPRALMWTIAPVLAAYCLLLYPGLLTPHAERIGDSMAVPTGLQGGSSLDAYVSQLSDVEAQALSDALLEYKHGLTATPRKPRVLKGPENAPVQIVEFTDMRCGHCRALVETMGSLARVAPAGSFAVDARHFPLDSECNPHVPMSDKTGIRCAGAKAQICLEQAPDYWQLRDKLFTEQERLTPALILELASSGTVGRGELEACMASPETARKLAEDIEYASQIRPRGTPIVLLNGRSAPPAPAFLYAMMLARGNPDAPEFARLPPAVPHAHHHH